MGNVLLRYPGLDTFDDETIKELLNEPLTGLVTRIDGTPLGPNAPKYIVEPTEYSRLSLFPDFKEIQLIDFGGCLDPSIQLFLVCLCH